MARVLLNAKGVREGVAFEHPEVAQGLGHAVPPHAGRAGPIKLLEHRAEAVGLRDAVRLGDEDELPDALLGSEVEQLILVLARRDDPPVVRPQQWAHRLFEPAVLPWRQGDDLEAAGVGGLARPGTDALDSCPPLVREREQHRDSRRRAH